MQKRNAIIHFTEKLDSLRNRYLLSHYCYFVHFDFHDLSLKISSFLLLSGPPLQVKKKPTQQWVGLFFSVPSMFNSLRVQIPYKGLENRSIRETQGHCREAMSERSVYQSCDLTNRNRI